MVRLGNIAIATGLGLAATSAIFALTGSGGSTSSLRGATKHALLKAMVSATKIANRRRLKNTKMDCNKVDTFLDDLMGCVYGAAFNGDVAGCIVDAAVEDSVLPASGMIQADTIKANAKGALNAGTVTFPRDKADKITGDIKNICRNGRRPGVNTQGDALVEESDIDAITQEQFNELFMDYFDDEILPLCEELDVQLAELNLSLDECQEARIAIEETLVMADLGNSTEYVAALSE